MGGILWTREEDFLLTNCIKQHGEGKWHRVPQLSGLKRCRKSCRLRWLNYLRPNIKRGKFSHDEEDLILKLHRLLGNRWSLIAGRLPGRTANDVKNYWNHHLRRRTKSETKPSTSLDEQVEVISPQASIIKPTSLLQQLLGFWPPEIRPMPFLTVGESHQDDAYGAQELMGVLQEHDHGDDKEEEEEDGYDACFEACARIYRQLFHDLHELDDLNHDHDHQVVDHACMHET